MGTKDSLIAAAAELLWERGYTATSPAMIQKRSTVGQGSMYHHFSGKADLAAAAMRYSAAQLRAAAEEALAGGGPVLARIHAFLDAQRHPLAGCPLGRLVQDQEVAGDPELRAPAAEFFGWLEDRIAGLLAEGVRTGELRPQTDTRATASLVVAAVQGGYVLARAKRELTAFRRTIQGTRQAVSGLAADPAARQAHPLDPPEPVSPEEGTRP